MKPPLDYFFDDEDFESYLLSKEDINNAVSREDETRLDDNVD